MTLEIDKIIKAIIWMAAWVVTSVKYIYIHTHIGKVMGTIMTVS